PFVRCRVRGHLRRRQCRSRRVPARRVADEPREIADQKHDLVAQLLELPQFIEQHCMPEVQIRGGLVETGLDDQRSPRRQPLLEYGLEQDVGRTAPYDIELFGNWLHGGAMWRRGPRE